MVGRLDLPISTSMPAPVDPYRHGGLARPAYLHFHASAGRPLLRLWARHGGSARPAYLHFHASAGRPLLFVSLACCLLKNWPALTSLLKSLTDYFLSWQMRCPFIRFTSWCRFHCSSLIHATTLSKEGKHFSMAQIFFMVILLVALSQCLWNHHVPGYQGKPHQHCEQKGKTHSSDFNSMLVPSFSTRSQIKVRHSIATPPTPCINPQPGP